MRSLYVCQDIEFLFYIQAHFDDLTGWLQAYLVDQVSVFIFEDLFLSKLYLVSSKLGTGETVQNKHLCQRYRRYARRLFAEPNEMEKTGRGLGV